MDMETYRKQRAKNELTAFLKRFAAAFGVLCAILWGFFWLPWFRISAIELEGVADNYEVNEALSPYLASLNSFLLPNNNFFLLRAEILENLLKEKSIGLAEADKIFPATVKINFPETDPWLIYCSQGDCFYVSKSGILSDRAPRFSENPIPEVFAGSVSAKLGDILIPPAEAERLSQIFQKLEKPGIRPVSVHLDGGEIKVVSDEKWYLRLSKNSDITRVFTDLTLLLEEKIKLDRSNLEYIDMRFPDKAFYKLR